MLGNSHKEAKLFMSSEYTEIYISLNNDDLIIL